jgi:N4-gp56 family major capsid protein
MAITKAADLTNSVVTSYQKNYYMISMDNPGVWAQFIDWQTPISESGGAGSSFDFPIYGETDLAESALTEDADVTPESISDDNVTVTPYEYGKVFAVTKKARYTSRTNLDQVMGKLTAMNRVNSIDRILRRAACGRGSSYPTQTILANDGSTMVSLDKGTAGDLVDYAFLMDLAAYAASQGVEPFNGGGFLSIVHPRLFAEIKQLTEWKSIGYYQDSMNIYGSIEKPITLAGITFVPSRMGRLFLGSGTAAQAATTLTAAANKGATTIAVADGTGLSAGNYATIGTLETESVNPGSNLEQVYIVSSNASSGAATLTIRANGVADDFGLRFNHAAGESVVEADNVAAIPLIGKNSLLGVYGSDTGKYGKALERDDIDIMKRIKHYGWYWFGGVGVIQKNIVLGKCAITGSILGYN